ncbi:SGNH/GDSL hydrolase family protein [Heyndrickxia sp. NPDC080065]|uniref:SGNH/GDSL hydrolase family protein n=1 Tax=Heyndrickxia sp. NPDC080065 TaxID=3390568 RepID=UPI003CFFB34E
MKKILTLLLTILLFVSGCSFGFKEHTLKTMNGESKTKPPVDFIPKDLSIVSIGDSLTEGIGDSSNNGGYIPYLRSDLETLKEVRKASFKNYGVMGNRTDQLVKRLQQNEIRSEIEKADLVMITIGGNDVMKVFKDNFSNLKISKFEHELIGYKQRLNEIIKTIREYNKNAGIVLIGIYNPFMKWFSDIKEVDEIILDWNNTSKQVINQYNKSLFIPISDIFEDQEKDLLYSDNFHPNDQGYKLIANRVFDYLNDSKEIMLNE